MRLLIRGVWLGRAVGQYLATTCCELVGVGDEESKKLKGVIKIKSIRCRS